MGAFDYFLQLCKQALEDNDAEKAFEAYRYLLLVFMREDMCKECATCADALRNFDGCIIDKIEALIDSELR